MRTKSGLPVFGLNKAELKQLAPLQSPARIQDFLERLRANFEEHGDTCMSPRRVLREGRAHCFEGALMGALCLRLIGYKPLIMDLKSVWHDDDHVVAVWRERGRWGALSKTNHAVLRYREPIYRSLRELAASYFHEYFTDDGKKTLRSFSKALNLARFDSKGWVTSEKNLWWLIRTLDKSPHEPLLTKSMIKNLRKADKLEIKAGKLVKERKIKRRP